jgi:hypothetical protein
VVITQEQEPRGLRYTSGSGTSYKVELQAQELKNVRTLVRTLLKDLLKFLVGVMCSRV